MQLVLKRRINPVCNPHVSLVLLLLLLHAGCNRSSSFPEASRGSTISSSSDSIAPKLPARASEMDLSKIRFVSVPGGTTRLGSLRTEPGRRTTMERPQTVKVDPNDMSFSEITRAQWFAIMEPKRTVNASEANWPITNITWHQANQFCQILTIKTGIVHRLPTEAEWEHACRAGSEEMISIWKGNCSLSEAITSFHRTDPGKLNRGILASCNIATGKILPVGYYGPNKFGLVDMHGNCWEWVSLDETLTEPPSPLHAPIRGGSAISTDPLECRSANRAWQPMSQAAIAIGFRVLRESTN